MDEIAEWIEFGPRFPGPSTYPFVWTCPLGCPVFEIRLEAVDAPLEWFPIRVEVTPDRRYRKGHRHVVFTRAIHRAGGW